MALEARRDRWPVCPSPRACLQGDDPHGASSRLAASFDTAASSSLRLDLALPLGAVVSGIPRHLDFLRDDSLPPVWSSRNKTAVETITFTSPAPPVSESYYLFASATAHTSKLWFCGAQVPYSVP